MESYFDKFVRWVSDQESPLKKPEGNRTIQELLFGSGKKKGKKKGEFKGFGGGKSSGKGASGAWEMPLPPNLTGPVVGTPTLPVAAAAAPVVAQLAVPNEADYLAPFLQAEGAANTAFNTAKPVIADQFNQLRAKLAEQQQLLERGQTARTQGRGAEDAALRAQLEATMGAGQADMAKQGITGSPVAAANAEMAARLGAMQAGSANSDRLLEDIALAQKATHSANLGTTASAETAANMTARQNLESILGQLGGQKAQAKQRYVQDRNNVEQQNFAMREQEKMNQAYMQSQAAYEGASAPGEAPTSPRDQFMNVYPDIKVKYPAASTAFEKIIEAAGNGPMGRAQALSMLTAQADAFRSGKNPTGKRLKPETIAEWITAYYDNKKPPAPPKPTAPKKPPSSRLR